MLALVLTRLERNCSSIPLIKKKKKKCEEEIASFRRLTEFLMQSRNYSHLLASNDLEFPTNVSQNIKIFQLCTEGRVVEEKKKKKNPDRYFDRFV